MWKILLDSVEGESHKANGQPCQDYSCARQCEYHGETFLLLAVADGAGSASHADVAARLACETAVAHLEALITSGRSLHEFDGDQAVDLYREVRSILVDEAEQLEVEVRQLACTLLVAAVGDSVACFAQIGDGAIVIERNGSYETVFWPQSGEYANTTMFLSDENYEEHVVFHQQQESVNEVAMFTDGLERLALVFAEQGVHTPFFEPMFQAIRDADNVEDLQTPMRAFLQSPAINERTDDDKTLVLATRIRGGVDESPVP